MRDGCWLNCSQRIVRISTKPDCSWLKSEQYNSWWPQEDSSFAHTIRPLNYSETSNERLACKIKWILFEFSSRFWFQIFLRLSCVTVEVETLKATIRASCKKRNHNAQKTRTSIDIKNEIKSKQINWIFKHSRSDQRAENVGSMATLFNFDAISKGDDIEMRVLGVNQTQTFSVSKSLFIAHCEMFKHQKYASNEIIAG